MRRVCVLVACFLMLGIVTPVAMGQITSATVVGTVRDAQGAAVPSATVTVTGRGNGVSRTATTNSEGRFTIPNVPPGTVDISVTAQGFAALARQDVALEVGQSVTLDFEVGVGAVKETVVVGGREVAIDSTRSVVDDVISTKAIESLPLNGRNFLELAFLIPGNAPAPNFDPTKTNTVTISSAGQLGRGGNVMIDGADNNDDVVGGPLQNVTEESVQEFQISTNRFSAETGRSASSAINIVTKSGNDDLHGSASIFGRNSSWQALPVTYDRTNGGAPPFDRQQYSAAVGGPLVAQKAFWFGAIEYRNQDGAVLVGTRNTTNQTITRSFAMAPLDDLLGSGRVDFRPSNADSVFVRYAGEKATDTAASSIDRAIGSASQRQISKNHYQSVVGTWTRIVSPTFLNAATVSLSTFHNKIVPVEKGPQLTFPSIQDGTSFRVPQGTDQRRFQLSDTVTWVKGAHSLRFGGEWQRIDAGFDLGVFQDGRIELVQDFPDFDHNGDGKVDDNDLLFAVTLRSGKPDQALVIPDADNNHVAMFVQDDWRVRDTLTINAGLRYEFDTDVKNIARYDEINPIVQPFLHGSRGKDLNNFGPRIGFNWTPQNGRMSVHGGYGIYYDRITLEIQSLERGLDGRALPIEVKAGNVFFIDPNTGQFPPFAPSITNPFTGFILPGAGASGINIIDNSMQNPSVQQFNLGIQHKLPWDVLLRVDGLHNLGTHFIIGRPVGTVFNPVVGGPDRVVNLESSVNTKYDGLLISAEQRRGNHGFRAAYTLSKTLNYANDDQIPFANGPIDPNNLYKEYGPTPNDQRHRFTFAAWGTGPLGINISPIWTIASGVPMDILMPDAQSRIPEFQRNAGGRLFKNARDLNKALAELNQKGGVNGVLLPLVDDSAKFSDSFNSVDLRVSRPFSLKTAKIEPIFEVFNLFNVTNILGVNVKNYSGYSNVLVRDSSDPSNPGFLHSSSFGHAVNTAGGVFGSGGPRAIQLAVRVTF